VSTIATEKARVGMGALPHESGAAFRVWAPHADFSKWFDFVELRATHFDTTAPGGKGALAWFALLKRNDRP